MALCLLVATSVACGNGSQGPAGPAGPTGATGPSGPTGATGPSGGGQVAVRTRDEAPGPNCPFGGVAIEVGTDLNQNGVLDDMEVGSASYVCAGSNPQNEVGTVVGQAERFGDADRTGIAVALSQADTSTSVVVATASTSASGLYIFENLPVGNYDLTFSTPRHFAETTRNISVLPGVFQVDLVQLRQSRRIAEGELTTVRFSSDSDWVLYQAGGDSRAVNVARGEDHSLPSTAYRLFVLDGEGLVAQEPGGASLWRLNQQTAWMFAGPGGSVLRANASALVSSCTQSCDQFGCYDASVIVDRADFVAETQTRVLDLQGTCDLDIVQSPAQAWFAYSTNDPAMSGLYVQDAVGTNRLVAPDGEALLAHPFVDAFLVERDDDSLQEFDVGSLTATNIAPATTGGVRYSPAGDAVMYEVGSDVFVWERTTQTAVRAGPDASFKGFVGNGRFMFFGAGGNLADLTVFDRQNGMSRLVESSVRLSSVPRLSNTVAWQVDGQVVSEDLRTGRRRAIAVVGSLNPSDDDAIRVVVNDNIRILVLHQRGPVGAEVRGTLLLWNPLNNTVEEIDRGVASFAVSDDARLVYDVYKPGRPDDSGLWIRQL